MSKLRVLVCDDDADRAKGLRNDIASCLGKRATVSLVAAKGLQEMLEQLGIRARRLLDKPRASEGEALEFDKADIALLDNNLLNIFTDSPVVTGETFIGQVIAFSACAFVGILNRQPDVHFDLQLRPDTSSKADLSITSAQAAEQGLWYRQWSGLRPWYWPFLAEMPAKRRAQWDWLKTRLDQPILSALGFKGASRALSADQLSRFGTGGEKLTFREFFVEECRALAPDLRKKLRRNSNVVARVVASEISSWINHDVLMRQEVLVDAPHLIARAPSYVNRMTSLGKLKPHQQIEIAEKWAKDDKSFKEHRFGLEFWLPHPAWWINDIDRDGAMTAGLLSALARAKAEDHLVFCEDASRFAHASKARRYRISEHSLAGVRYLWDKKARGYAPRLQLMR